MSIKGRIGSGVNKIEIHLSEYDPTCNCVTLSISSTDPSIPYHKSIPLKNGGDIFRIKNALHKFFNLGSYREIPDTVVPLLRDLDHPDANEISQIIRKAYNANHCFYYKAQAKTAAYTHPAYKKRNIEPEQEIIKQSIDDEKDVKVNKGTVCGDMAVLKDTATTLSRSRIFKVRASDTPPIVHKFSFAPTQKVLTDCYAMDDKTINRVARPNVEVIEGGSGHLDWLGKSDRFYYYREIPENPIQPKKPIFEYYGKGMQTWTDLNISPVLFDQETCLPLEGEGVTWFGPRVLFYTDEKGEIIGDFFTGEQIKDILQKAEEKETKLIPVKISDKTVLIDPLFLKKSLSDHKGEMNIPVNPERPSFLLDYIRPSMQEEEEAEESDLETVFSKSYASSKQLTQMTTASLVVGLRLTAPQTPEHIVGNPDSAAFIKPTL